MDTKVTELCFYCKKKKGVKTIDIVDKYNVKYAKKGYIINTTPCAECAIKMLEKICLIEVDELLAKEQVEKGELPLMTGRGMWLRDDVLSVLFKDSSKLENITKARWTFITEREYSYLKSVLVPEK